MSLFQYHFVQYQLRNAMRQGKLHEVERILCSRTECNLTIYRDELPLYLACAMGNARLADIALNQSRYGICEYASRSSETSLHVAAELGSENVADQLLYRRADVMSRTKEGITPLHLAALSGHEGMIKLLLQHGADVKGKDNHGFTALHMACMDGHCELVSLLIEAGANVNEPSKEGIAPLHVAAEQGHAWMVKELIESGAELDVLTCGHYTPLDCAVLNRRIEVVMALIESGASLTGNRWGNSPLHHALYKQDCTMVEILLDLGAKVDSRVLAIACDCKEDPDDHIVRLLLAHGADVTLEDFGGYTPLHYALSNDRTAVVELLLDCGADVNHVTHDGRTPLEMACGRANYHHEIVQVLIEHGADFLSEDEVINCCNAYSDSSRAEWQMFRPPLGMFELMFTKLQTAGLISPDEVLLYPLGVTPTLNRDLKEKYRRLCAQEVSLMKQTKIGASGVSYHDLLLRTDAICRNKEVVEALSKDFTNNFHHYQRIFKVRIRKSLQRWKLVDRSYPVFVRLVKFDFPRLVTDRVFSYFNTRDLRTLIEVGETLGIRTGHCLDTDDFSTKFLNHICDKKLAAAVENVRRKRILSSTQPDCIPVKISRVYEDRLNQMRS